MPYLRYVRNHKHFFQGSFDIQRVRKSFEGDESPSFYFVDNVGTAERVCVLHGMSFKRQVEELAYVLLPPGLFSENAIDLVAHPGGFTHPLLASAHRNAVGLTAGLLGTFCEAICASNVIGDRLSKNRVRQIASLEIRDVEYGWAARQLVEGREGWSEIFSETPYE